MEIAAIAARLGLSDSNSIVRKAEDLRRLSDVQFDSSIIGVGEVAKAVICLEIAASRLQVIFDRSSAIRVSGMSEKAYIRCFNTMQSVIGVKARLDVRELAVQLGCVILISFMHKRFSVKENTRAVKGYRELLDALPGKRTRQDDTDLSDDSSIDGNIEEPFECYYLSDIQAGLGLMRNQMIAITLLVGSDHDLQGVPGFGVETALRFVKLFSDVEVLVRLSEVGKCIIPPFQRDIGTHLDYDRPTLHEGEAASRPPHCSHWGHPGSRKAHLMTACLYCINCDSKSCIMKSTGFKCDCSICIKDRIIKEQRKQEIWQLKACQKVPAKHDFPSKKIIDMYLHDSTHDGRALSQFRTSEPLLVVPVMEIAAIASRLGLTDSNSIVHKAEELRRLSDVQFDSSIIGVGEVAKDVICLEIAAYRLQVISAIRVSDMSEKAYIRCFNAMQNGIGVKARLDVRELAVQLGCVRLISFVQKGFSLYNDRCLAALPVSRRANTDFSRPVFTAVAFYLCAKKHKLKVDKFKVIELSCTSASEFINIANSLNDLCFDVLGSSKEKKDPRAVKGHRELLDALTGKRTRQDDTDVSDDSSIDRRRRRY